MKKSRQTGASPPPVIPRVKTAKKGPSAAYVLGPQKIGQKTTILEKLKKHPKKKSARKDIKITPLVYNTTPLVKNRTTRKKLGWFTKNTKIFRVIDTKH